MIKKKTLKQKIRSEMAGPSVDVRPKSGQGKSAAALKLARQIKIVTTPYKWYQDPQGNIREFPLTDPEAIKAKTEQLLKLNSQRIEFNEKRMIKIGPGLWVLMVLGQITLNALIFFAMIVSVLRGGHP